MEIRYTKKKIEFKKEPNALDEIVIDFTLILNKLGINYVLVSGYVSILFGRSRSSEDIDLFIEKLNFNKFQKLWNKLCKKFECINIKDIKDAYFEYLLKKCAIRFARKDEFIPNIEIKFPKIELDYWTLEHKKEVLLNGHKIFISPLELQIPFKLYLGSEKDIEDAVYLYKLFKDKLNIPLLQEFNRKLKIESLANKYLR